MDIMQINYGVLTAYKIGDVVFCMDGKTFKSKIAFKQFVGKSKGLVSSEFLVIGATQKIIDIYYSIVSR